MFQGTERRVDLVSSPRARPFEAVKTWELSTNASKSSKIIQVWVVFHDKPIGF
jgi:hypothetical protein